MSHPAFGGTNSNHYLSVTGIAQNKTDEKEVKACLENYMSGDGKGWKKPLSKQ